MDRPLSVALLSLLSRFPESLRVLVRLLSASASPRDNLLTMCLLRNGITWPTSRVADEIPIHRRAVAE